MRHMGNAAIAGQAQADALRLGLGAGQVVAQRVQARGGVDHQHLRIDHGLDDGREGLLRVVGQLGEQQAVEREALALLQQGVAVGRGLGHLGRADGAAGPGHVLHHHRLAPQRGQLVGQRARELVGAAPGRHGHDDAHRLVRKAVGRGQGRRRVQGQGGEQGKQQCAQRRRGADHGSAGVQRVDARSLGGSWRGVN